MKKAFFLAIIGITFWGSAFGQAVIEGGWKQVYFQNHDLRVETTPSETSRAVYLQDGWKQVYLQNHRLRVDLAPTQRRVIGPIDFQPPTLPPFVIGGTDTDSDGVRDSSDNCRYTANPLQEDRNFDRIGDACENDYDNDGEPNATDMCPYLPSEAQGDIDGDRIGDACDNDRDGDGIINSHEVTVCTGEGTTRTCLDPNKWDTDNDNISDYADCAKFDPTKGVSADCGTITVIDNPPPPPNPDVNNPLGDDDHDGILNGVDNCRVVYNPGQQDRDNDGVGDACEIRTGEANPFLFIKGGSSGCSLVRE